MSEQEPCQPSITNPCLSKEDEEKVEDFIKAANTGVKHQQDLIQSDLGVARTLACGTHASGSHLTKTLITNGCLNSWDVQSKHIQPENGKAEALYSGECRGGGGESYVMQEHVYCLQGNGIDRADTAGCNGKGWKEDESYTLNTVDRHAICIGNGQVNDAISPSEEVAKTLNCLDDPMKVVTFSDVHNALNARDGESGVHSQMLNEPENNFVVSYGLDRASFNQGKNALYDFSVEEETAQTLVARGPGGGTSETVGALCASDYKGVGNQYVNDGKCIVQRI